MTIDYYAMLEVERTASQTDIKKAFRKMAHKYHPDKHKGDKKVEEKFKELNGAYEVLKDPNKRAHYDRFGTDGPQGGPGGPGGYGDSGFGGDFQDLFGDVFSDFFGGRQRRPGPEPGNDLRYNLDITFDEAVFGASKDIKIPKTDRCGTCAGSGAKAGTSPETCKRCGGSGQERFQQGFLNMARTCQGCRGTGAVITSPCTTCAGAGTVRSSSTLSINIPPGIDTGARLRVSGEGEPGPRGGPNGDLYVFVTVEPHQIFKREDTDIICEVPISFPQASLGAEIEVPTIEGNVKLKIPAGTQTGKVMRLRGKGVTSLRSSRRGDQLVYIRVETPSKLNKRQRELLEEFALISNDDIFPNKKGFFDKVKEIFE
ncbi:Chaperone protein DnaJ [hydrothermal vent metagenome]|uniref:Chaperone protein DnaJ n=1 Tax=hydrothermal vent metagenome TaxID=652676 RepID=A0A3B0QW07_9ZZZZ